MVEVYRHYLISGRVQGVGFRAFTQSSALELKLKGWVRNLEDGRVEVVILGSKSEISEFETRLKRGPAHGRVDALEIREDQVRESKENENLTGFEVRKDGSKPCSEN